jgi:hypothetical protein
LKVFFSVLLHCLGDAIVHVEAAHVVFCLRGDVSKDRLLLEVKTRRHFIRHQIRYLIGYSIAYDNSRLLRAFVNDTLEKASLILSILRPILEPLIKKDRDMLPVEVLNGME